MYRTILFLLLQFAVCKLSPAQLTDKYLQAMVKEKNTLIKAGVQYPEQVAAFYVANQYKLSWTREENKLNRDALKALLANAAAVGLDEKNYQSRFISNYSNGKIALLAEQDSVNADLLFTDAAIHYISDLSFGSKTPSLGYVGLKYAFPLSGIPSVLLTHYQKNTLTSLSAELNSGSNEIEIIQSKLVMLQNRMRQQNFRDVVVRDKKVLSSNTSLVKRLYQLSFIDSVSGINDSLLQQTIKQVQQTFDLLPDGVIRTRLLEQLNMSLTTRITQLTDALNNYRWLNAFARQQKVIVVNIPAAYLKVYDGENVILQMKLIVGKKSTPTPTLLSVSDQVIVYPYWHVPYSIATKELLPHIKRNISYLNKGNYQVLNNKGAVVNPYKINWRRLSSRNFPYVIRQGTGCDNALGLLKLNFYNPFGVYLHDTSTPLLFGTNKRFYSHGCMRMEKPFELGRLLLMDNSIAIDTLKQKECLLNQSPVVVPVKDKIPVLVWYNPVAINAEGRLVFYEDIYDKFSNKK